MKNKFNVQDSKFNEVINANISDIKPETIN